MPQPDTELRRAMRELVEAGVRVRAEGLPTYGALLDLYGSNAAIADAAGFSTAAQAIAAHRGRFPRARKTSLARTGATARRERQSFLRNLQRYRTGERTPDKLLPLLERLREEAITERVDVSSSAELAELFVGQGVTVPQGWSILLRVSDDERWRDPPTVSFRPPAEFADAVGRRHWALAADDFFAAWCFAYCGVYGTAIEVEALVLEGGPG